MTESTRNPFGTRGAFPAGRGESATVYHLERLEQAGLPSISRLPLSIKILLEAALRNCDGRITTEADVEALARWSAKKPGSKEVPFLPARVILQDFTGVPAVVDLAAMRGTMERLGGDPARINPAVPVDLVIDHSVQVDVFGTPLALKRNAEIEFERNRERYEFLRWGQQAFDNFRVVPPATGIVHQVNLEYLAKVVMRKEKDGEVLLFPDTLVGTDSHTTMINGLGVLGWGVGGIEAEAAMLGQPSYLIMPEVIGFKLVGSLREGVTATDLVLTVTQMLRKKGVVEKFVEFYGPGLSQMSLPDRATVANMAPEYGATMGFFPVDAETLRYLRRTGRSEAEIDRVEAYSKLQGLFRTDETRAPEFTDTLDLDLSTVQPSLAGPKRPQDRVALSSMKSQFRDALQAPVKDRGFGLSQAQLSKTATTSFNGGGKLNLGHGAVVIAAITSCTNTSNPSVMVGAGLLAKKAAERGLKVPPYVKTSLAPGSKVVTEYLKEAGVLPSLADLGFHLVGYGCTTCIGNSGPLPEPVAKAVSENDLVAAAVLSGNRNFEGRVHPLVRANYLASPPLVVAYALAGTVDIDLTTEPLGKDAEGKAGVSPGHLAFGSGSAGVGGQGDPSRDVRQDVRKRLEGKRGVEPHPGLRRKALPLGGILDVYPGAAVFHQPHAGASRDLGHSRGAGSRAPRGQRDHRPHLARGRHRRGLPGGTLPERARGREEGLQLLRFPAWKRPRHAARDLRQHPDQEPDGSRGRGRGDHPRPERRADEHLRRRHAL